MQLEFVEWPFECPLPARSINLFRYRAPRAALRRIADGNLRPKELSALLLFSLVENGEAIDKLARIANAERLAAITPLLRVRNQASQRSLQSTLRIIELLPAESLRDLEAFLGTGLLFKEMIAFEAILNAPNNLVALDEKQDKANKVEDSLKEALRKIVAFAQEGVAGEFGKLLGKGTDLSYEALNEIAKAVKGK